MATRRVMLKYPEGLIKEPLVSRMVRRFNIDANIRRARVTDTVGEIALELEGAPDSVEQGIRFLQDQGVLVEPLEGDVVSP